MKSYKLFTVIGYCQLAVGLATLVVAVCCLYNQALYPNTPYPQKLNVSPRYNYESTTHCDNRPELEFPTHCDIVSRNNPTMLIESIPPVICVVEKIKTEDAYVSDDRVYELR